MILSLYKLSVLLVLNLGVMKVAISNNFKIELGLILSSSLKVFFFVVVVVVVSVSNLYHCFFQLQNQLIVLETFQPL